MADPLAAAVIEQLRERGLTLATAETDTGGLIGSLITDVPGCSVAYRGSIVPYHAGPQHTLLNVPADIIKTHGSGSEEAALARATGSTAVIPQSTLMTNLPPSAAIFSSASAFSP